MRPASPTSFDPTTGLPEIVGADELAGLPPGVATTDVAALVASVVPALAAGGHSDADALADVGGHDGVRLACRAVDRRARLVGRVVAARRVAPEPAVGEGDARGGAPGARRGLEGVAGERDARDGRFRRVRRPGGAARERGAGCDRGRCDRDEHEMCRPRARDPCGGWSHDGLLTVGDGVPSETLADPAVRGRRARARRPRGCRVSRAEPGRAGTRRRRPARGRPADRP